MIALLPAAGYGLRLHPYTLHTPKPLLDINGKAMIEHIIHKLEELPVDEVVVITNDKFYSHFCKWKEHFSSSLPIRILNDGTSSNETRLGSIGDIHFAVKKLNISDDVLIINADNMFTFSLLPSYEDFRKRQHSVIVLYDVGTKSEAAKMGVPRIDDQQRVMHFVEKPADPESTLISIGIYYYSQQAVALFQTYIDEGHSPDKTGEFVEWIHKQTPVYAFSYDHLAHHWYDIGSPEMLATVREVFK